MSKEVQFIRENVIKIDNTTIQGMKIEADNNHSGKLRFCFHESENANMQEMLFVVPNSGYARPHMHRAVAESHVIIDGEGYCVLFDESGAIIDNFKVSCKDKFIYRISKGIWHMVLPISKQMVIYEIREGKFDSHTNIFPEWAPREDEIEKVKRYKENLMLRIGGEKCLYHMESTV